MKMQKSNFLENFTSIENHTLPLMEDFYTLQGEGFHQGKAAYFIRLGGCDVGCIWCDVKESWDRNAHPEIKISEIVAKASNYPSKIAVITGGEPLMYDLTNLTKMLKQANFRTHIETSGAYNFSGEWDWVCLSPKKFKKPLPEIYPFVNELKIIVYNKTDFDWAETYAEKMPKNCKLFLQPEWSKVSQMLPLIVDYVKANPQWQISLQTHKYMNIP